MTNEGACSSQMTFQITSGVGHWREINKISITYKHLVVDKSAENFVFNFPSLLQSIYLFTISSYVPFYKTLSDKLIQFTFSYQEDGVLKSPRRVRPLLLLLLLPTELEGDSSSASRRISDLHLYYTGLQFKPKEYAKSAYKQ